MKSHKKIALLQRMFRYGCFAAIVLGSMAADDCFAVNPSFAYLNVTVGNISYQGNNNYRVDITVYNRSDGTIVLKEDKETFYVQTEILGRWQELSTSHRGDYGNTVLLPKKGRQVIYILNIPLNIPSLYTNSEGDINMMFKYLIRFVFGSEPVLRSNSGESSYWITPKTDTWVLREGM
ncbi:MAG: hypothetical protein M0Z67_03590 [Nitrospiraceae bacterium]|nr:hypothetical protein [Nitrospiraceae bacterium]